MNEHLVRLVLRTVLGLLMLLMRTGTLNASCPDDLTTTLRKYYQFSKKELQNVAAGKPVAKLLPATSNREIAVVGIIHINTTPDFFAEQIMDIEKFKRNKAVLQLSKMPAVPTASDLESFTMAPSDYEDLSECGIRDCSLKLPASEIKKFGGINWKARDAHQQADKIFKSYLVDLLSEYRAKGNMRLPIYADGEELLSVKMEFASVLEASKYLSDCAPEFYSYHQQTEGWQQVPVRQFIYLSKESFGFKPVLSLTEVSIYSIPQPGKLRYFVSSKQLYASHYYDASLSLTALIKSQNGIYMMYLNRSRTDALSGKASSLKKFFLKGRLVDSTIDSLKDIKSRVEQAFNSHR